MVTKAEVEVEGSNYLISLKKLLALDVVDIHGYIANEFGEPTFKPVKILFSDGSTIDVEGEHDFPYLCTDNPEISAKFKELYGQK